MSEDDDTNATGRGVSSADDELGGPVADEVDEADADGALDESTAGTDTATADGDVPSGPETAEDVQTLIDEVTEHDDDLARQVAAVAQTARERNQTVRAQGDELTDLEERIEEQAETIGYLQESLEETEAKLESKAETLEAKEERIEELRSHLKRKQADFQNYKKRAKKRQEQLKTRATEDLVSRIVGVRDNLKRALGEEAEDEDLRGGIEMTLREFDRVLADENVTEVDPEPGTEVDPQRHEVMVQVDSDLPEGTVADVFTPGYEMGEKVIQSAQVTVSNGAHADSDTDTGADSTDEDENGGDNQAESSSDPDDTEEAIELGGDVDDEAPADENGVSDTADADPNADEGTAGTGDSESESKDEHST